MQQRSLVKALSAQFRPMEKLSRLASFRHIPLRPELSPRSTSKSYRGSKSAIFFSKWTTPTPQQSLLRQLQPCAPRRLPSTTWNRAGLKTSVSACPGTSSGLSYSSSRQQKISPPSNNSSKKVQPRPVRSPPQNNACKQPIPPCRAFNRALPNATAQQIRLGSRHRLPLPGQHSRQRRAAILPSISGHPKPGRSTPSRSPPTISFLPARTWSMSLTSTKFRFTPTSTNLKLANSPLDRR